MSEIISAIVQIGIYFALILTALVYRTKWILERDKNRTDTSNSVKINAPLIKSAKDRP